MMTMGSSVTDLLNNKKKCAKGGVKIDMTGNGSGAGFYLTVEFGHPMAEVAENAQKAGACPRWRR